MKKYILLLNLLLSLFCISSIAKADPINYSKNIYSVSATLTGFVFVYIDPEHLYFDNVWSPIQQDNNPGPNPPVQATVDKQYNPGGFFDGNIYGRASALGTTSLTQVDGYLSSDSGNPVASLDASSHHEREFLANFQMLSISYDYYLDCQKIPTTGRGIAGGFVSADVNLIDKTTDSSVWSHDLKIYALGSPMPEDLLPTTGSIVIVLPLIVDQTYLLSIDTSLHFDIDGQERSVFGTAYIANLALNPIDLPPGAAPIPGTALLLGTGSGCLVLYSRKKLTAKN